MASVAQWRLPTADPVKSPKAHRDGVTSWTLHLEVGHPIEHVVADGLVREERAERSRLIEPGLRDSRASTASWSMITPTKQALQQVAGLT